MLGRARLWLGTLVEIRVSAAASADAIIERGFAAVEQVHRLLSFHDPNSELSRINRDAAKSDIAVSPITAAVLRTALDIAAVSDGAFDPTVGAALVRAGHRPRPAAMIEPDPAATWRDVHLSDRDQIRFARPLWLDFGGIAKGYAVDLALQALRDAGADAAVVNAGGDLGVFGDLDERIAMRALDGSARVIDLGLLRDGAAAGSANDGEDSAQFDGRTRRPLGARRAVTVIAPRCMLADALTKLVLRDPRTADSVLRRYGATACVIEADALVQRYGAAA